MQRLGRGDNEGSLALLRAMKVDRPDDLEIALFEALALKELRRYSEAKVALERVLDGTPEFRKPWTSLYYYGWVLMNTGDADGSRAAFTAFLEFEPTEGDAYFGLGLLDLERRDLDGAESNFLKAIEHAESAIRSGKANRAADWAKCKARLGEVMFERERFVAARDLLSDSLRLAPQSHEAWYLLHRVYKKLGDAEGAAQALARHQATKPPGVPTNP
ncbi:MAG: tetratricopeptide repeat protein [Planctomycetes bacterium]|nr:tetratricopeptide repeat protein [Planctomycetota bacterium]MCC7173309.1 tetratricopeptide repeat protein [Planctomycetota bacterium]